MPCKTPAEGEGQIEVWLVKGYGEDG
jgi:hypothetical protein